MQNEIERSGLPRMLFSIVALLSVLSSQSFAQSFNLPHETEVKALEILRSGLGDLDYAPSLHAAEALTIAGYGEEIVPVFLAKLEVEKNDARRAGFARELARAGDTSKIELIADILRKNDPSSRIAAAEALYKLAEVGDLAVMKQAAQSNEDVILRLMASGALIRHGDKDALQAIRDAYLTGDSDAIRIGAWLLGRVGEESDIALLETRLAETQSEFLRSFIHHSMASLGSEQGLKHLATNLSTKDSAIRAYAATFAGDAIAISLADVLIGLLSDPVADVRYRAAQSLLIFQLAGQE